MAARRRTTLERDVKDAVIAASDTLRGIYRGPYWPRRNNADASERHLSFAVAHALRGFGYDVMFEVPIGERGSLDLVAVDWSRGWQVAAEFKNLYQSRKQAESLARDISRLTQWLPLGDMRADRSLRLVVGSTWHEETKDAWCSERPVKWFAASKLGEELEAVGAEPCMEEGAYCEGDAHPQQWLLWAMW